MEPTSPRSEGCEESNREVNGRPPAFSGSSVASAGSSSVTSSGLDTQDIAVSSLHSIPPPVCKIQHVKDGSKGQSVARRGLRKSVRDFNIGTLLGEGAYARVHVCKLKTSNKYFAIKVMEKRFIIKEGKIKFVNMEKKLLSSLSHPLLAHLYFSFHDARFLYLVMDLCKGGPLQKLITYRSNENCGRFGVTNRACSLADTRFYLAETVSALQHLHRTGYVHRDVKPENILLCSSGHIKLTDFGTVKDEHHLEEFAAEEDRKYDAEKLSRQLSCMSSSSGSQRNRRGTFCGTAEYVSPEVLGDQVASVGADLWALGCLGFQLYVGHSPFRGASEYFTFQLIMNHGAAESDVIKIPRAERTSLRPANAPDTEASEDVSALEDLVNRLLAMNPEDRLGAANNYTAAHPKFDKLSENGPSALRSHAFFEGLDIGNICTTRAPGLPYPCDVPEPTYDGSSDDWLLAGDLTELEIAAEMELLSSSTHAASECPGDGGSSPASERQGSRDGKSAGELEQFLEASENILLDGLVVKRRNLFHTNTRHLLLTDYPRFLYIDPENVVLKGVIPIDRTTRISLKSSKTFDIVTPKRNYHITDLMSNGQRWKDEFEKLVKAKFSM